MIDLNQPLIGLSLSQCIASVIRREVLESNVRLLITSTKCETLHQFKTVCKEYSYGLWRSNPEGGIALAQLLWDKKLIVQPRILGEPLISHHEHGIWIPVAWRWYAA